MEGLLEALPRLARDAAIGVVVPGSQLAQAAGVCDDQNQTQSGKGSVGAYP